MTGRRLTALCALAAMLVVAAVAAGVDRAAAEAAELRISRGYGIHYLPLYIMERFKLVEKHAAAAGLANVKVSYASLDGGNVINDAMLAGALDIASLRRARLSHAVGQGAQRARNTRSRGSPASAPARCGSSPAIRT